MDNILLEKLSDYLNNNPDLITIREINKVSKILNNDNLALNFLLKEYLEYEYDYLKILNKLNVIDYMNNSYYKNIKLNNIKYNNWEIKIDKVKPYELFVCDNFKELNDEIIPQIGYFTKPFYYPTIYKDNRLWMSITPNEINTMKKDISDSFGNVLVLGLGLGYFPYMISLKNNVYNIDVIEIDKSAIDLYNKYIKNQFDSKKINVINYDAKEYIKKLDKKYDFIYIDLWHDVSDGIELYKYFKEYEKIYKDSIFRYWIYDTIKYYL